MANLEQITRDYVLRARTEGVAEVTAAAQRLGVATDAVATKTETVSRSQISAAAALERLQRSLDANYRSAKQFEAAQRDIDRAMQQGLITAARAADLQAMAATKYGQATLGSKALAAATQGVSAQLIALSAGAGPAGVFLAALGPWGLAAAVGLGALEKAFSAAAGAAHELAQKAIELRQFSENTGLTTNQVQALRSEASKFLLTSDEAQTAIQNFTARFNDLRLGQGELLTQVRRVNPALADQMAAITNAGDALTVFGQALQQTDNIFQRNALVRAATGRGGISAAQFLSGLDVSKVTQSYVEAGKALDQNLINKLSALEIEIGKTSGALKNNLASIFAQPILESELSFYKTLLGMSDTLKNMAPGQAMKQFMDWLIDPRLVAAFQFLTSDAPARRRAPAPPPAPSRPTGIPGIGDEFGGLGLTSGVPTAEYVVSTLHKQIAAMGEAATYAQKLDLAQKQLAISAKEAGLSIEQIAKANAVLMQSSALQQLQARIGLLGDLATVGQQVQAMQLRINLEDAKGVVLTKEQVDAIRLRTQVQAEAAKLQTQGQFGIFDSQRQIANAVNEIKYLQQGTDPAIKSTDDLAAAWAVMTKRLKEASDQAAVARSTLPGLTQFALDAANVNKQLDQMGVATLNAVSSGFTTFVQNLAQGKSTMDALTASALQLGSALIEIGTKSLATQALGSLIGGDSSSSTLGMTAGATSSATILTGAGATVAASFISGATAAAEILGISVPAAATSLPVAGGVTGTEVAAGGAAAGAALAAGGTAAGVALWGPIAALAAVAVGVAATLFGGSSQRQRQEEQAAEQQRQIVAQWHQMSAAFGEFLTTMQGHGTAGAFTQQLDQARQSMQQFADAAGKAGDVGGFNRAIAAYVNFQTRLTTDFDATLQDMFDALNQGLGSDSPVIQAENNVRKLGQTIQGFIGDVKTFTGGNQQLFAQAMAASQAYVLQVLQVKEPLTQTATALATLKGNAHELEHVLAELGVSADDAANAINAGINTALAQLAQSFTSDLLGKINTLQGNDWINQIIALLHQVDQLRSDAKSLGVNQSLVDQFLGASAQKIIDDAHLTGQAFQNLITAFPTLAGVVHEFTAALVRSADDIKSAKQSYQDQLFTLQQDQTTLAGQLAVFDRTAERARQDEVLKGGQALADLEALQAAQRLDIIKKFNDAAVAAQQQALQDAQNFLRTFANNITSFLASLTGGSQSPLSPLARLNSAQSSYSSQYSLALTSTGQAQRDALNQITSYASTLIEAAKAYYGSSAGFQSIFSSVTGQLGGLPAQIDPATLIVNAVNTASTDIRAAQLAMQNALIAVLNTGNLQNIATTLLAYLPQIDTNTDNGISFQEMQNALGANYAVGTLKNIFDELDGNGDGILEKSELIKASTTGIKINTLPIGDVHADTTATASNTGQMQTQLLALAQVSSNTLTTANNTASDAIYLPNLPQILSQDSNINTIVQRQLSATNAQDAHWGADTNTVVGASIGQFAHGGVVSGIGSSTSDSNLIWASVGEGIITAAATRALGGAAAIDDLNAGRLPLYPVANDNSAAVEAQVRALRAELKVALEKIAEMTRAGAEHVAGNVRASGGETCAVLEDVSKRLRRDRAA